MTWPLETAPLITLGWGAIGEALYAQRRIKPRDQRTPETQTVHVCLLPAFSLTARSLRIYRSRASSLAARRWEALDAPRFVSAPAVDLGQSGDAFRLQNGQPLRMRRLGAPGLPRQHPRLAGAPISASARSRPRPEPVPASIPGYPITVFYERVLTSARE